jgi:hypothetical protein
MSGPIWTVDDLEESGTRYGLYDLEWRWDEDSPNTPDAHTNQEHLGFVATLRLDEDDTGPLGAKGPCLAVYRKVGREGEVHVTITPVA